LRPLATMLHTVSSLLALGYVVQQPAGLRPAGCSAVRAAAPQLMAEEPLFTAETSRRAVLAALLGAGVGAGATPAFAGYVTNLGIEVTAPKDADIDDELLSSKSVQSSLSNLKGYKAAASSLKSSFSSDSNMVLIPSIRKEFDFSKLRDDLNVVTTVFDDTTQGTVDRLGRAILYDLTELENASRLKKEETTRTAKKVATVDKWFAKLDGDFANFLAYLP